MQCRTRGGNGAKVWGTSLKKQNGEEGANKNLKSKFRVGINQGDAFA